jgi:hypothetical protein
MNQTAGLDARAADRDRRHEEEKIAQEEKYRYEREQFEKEKAAQEARDLRAAEEERRQEKHETGEAKSQMETGLVEKAAGREEKLYARQQAYEQAKQGLMLRDAAMVEDALRQLMPEAKGDEISYGRTEGGARKVTARPGEAREVPKFIFHPDGYVGVQFPGQEKPTVFENQDEAFKNVLAPMSPERWTTAKGGARPQDIVTERKNMREAQYKERKLRADIHADAHEAAMKQFEADGYYQPALYNEEQYQAAYNDYVQKATGTTPKARPEPSTRKGKAGTPKQYRGKERPEGFPNARQGPRGGWYIQKKGKWYPILEGKEKSPESSPSSPRGPGRSPMPMADADIESAGVGARPKAKEKREFTPEQKERIRKTGVRRDFDRRGKNVSDEGQGEIYQGTSPPPDYPDAQYDRDEGVWRYFDETDQTWKKVRV